MDKIRIARPTWRRSIIFKIFVVSFVCIHLPLIALILSLGGIGQGQDLVSLLVVLGATLVGTVVCLLILWQFMSPLRQLTSAIVHYRQTGVLGERGLDLRGENEIAVVTRAVAGMVGEIDELTERLNIHATHEPLTGLANQQAMFERGSRQIARSRTSGEPVSVIMFNLDHLSEIIEQGGRELGDRVLVVVGDVVRKTLSSKDFAAHMGSGTFMTLLAGSDLQTARQLAERLRLALGGVTVDPLTKGSLTASFGVSEMGADITLLADLAHSADMALFKAREAGGDRVESGAPIRVRKR